MISCAYPVKLVLDEFHGTTLLWEVNIVSCNALERQTFAKISRYDDEDMVLEYGIKISNKNLNILSFCLTV